VKLPAPRLAIYASAFLLCLGGCSDEDTAPRKIFVAQCLPALRDRELCTCMFEELRKEYFGGEIVVAATSQEQPTQEWQRSMAKVTLTCLRMQ
jgi:hypothetical protein